MEIRNEHGADAAAIAALIRAAFKDDPRSSQTEAEIVAALRAAGALTVSLVAVRDGLILGHVACSPVAIDNVEGDWFGLAPLAVQPDAQRRGIGEALVRAGLARLKQLGAQGCVVLGDPRYYGRFGFAMDPNLRYPEAPPHYFQALSFQGPSPSGIVTYHPAFAAS